MSHHLDSPLARQDIRLDITDLYVFRGETGTVFAINVCHSIFGAIPVPGYHPEGMYEFKIDFDGDAIEELDLSADIRRTRRERKAELRLAKHQGRRRRRPGCFRHRDGARRDRRDRHHGHGSAHLGRQSR